MSLLTKAKVAERIPTPGTVPGAIFFSEDALPTRVTLHRYNKNGYEKNEINIEAFSQARDWQEDPEYHYWVEAQGLGSPELFDAINKYFNVGKLVLEDISRTYQRPGFEEYEKEGYCFILNRILRFDSHKALLNEQYSMILAKNVLLTLDENYEDCLDPIRHRLSDGHGNIRALGPSYLMYAMVDTIIDNYYALMIEWSDRLDMIEATITRHLKSNQLKNIQLLKRDLIMLRRVAWPERDKLNEMLRSDTALIQPEVKVYLKDAYDHCIQVIDFAESVKEIAMANIDLYMSINSNRTNDIMKVLTVISSIFIPLTFIAGLYGMNFQREDPVTHKVMPYNMPELFAPHGYMITLGVMVIIAVLQVLYFWRKGWFK